MKKLFTLLTLLLATVGGGATSAWADAETIFDAAADGWSAGGVDLTTGTTTVGDVTWYSGGNSSIDNGATVEGITWGKRLKLGGSSTFQSGKTLVRVFTFTPSSAGKVRVYCTHGSSSGTRTTYISQSITTTKNDITTALGSFAATPENKSGVAEADVEADEMVYVWADNNVGIYGITFEAAGAAAPVFSPVTGSSVAEGAKITITSENATSIKYKWTSSSETPADGWSTYDADAKVTVPAASDGTPYLHAQGFKGEDGGTAGYAQYTITAPDTEAPTLSSTTPADAATNVAVDGNIVLTFNENVACTTNATLTPEGGDAINLTPVVDGTTVTYAYSGLAYTKAYTFSLAANSVEDLAGNNYASAISFGFTTVQETVATPTFTVYGNKVVKIECATVGAKIYYGGSDVKTGTKTEYTDMFIPAASGTIYAYATKAGANDSELASKEVTLPVVGTITDDKLITLQPDVEPGSNDITYPTTGYQKAGYSLTIADGGSIKNSPMDKYPRNFKISAGRDITVTPPADVTITAIKIIGANNNSNTDTKNVQVGDGFSIDGSAALMPKNVFVNDEQVMSEVVVKPTTPAAGAAVVFSLEKESRLYVEVYGTTSAISEAITPANAKSTYVTTHALDFSGVAGLKAYVATAAAGGSVTLAEVTTVPAGTPLMLVGTASTEYTVPVAASASTPAVNMFKAGDGAKTFNGSTYDYILFTDGLFYKIGSGSVPVGKAYLHCDADPTTAGAPSLSIDFGGTTGIDLVKGSEIKANGEYYNLAGQRVAQPTKGLYIVNGKKVVIK